MKKTVRKSPVVKETVAVIQGRFAKHQRELGLAVGNFCKARWCAICIAYKNLQIADEAGVVLSSREHKPVKPTRSGRKICHY